MHRNKDVLIQFAQIAIGNLIFVALMLSIYVLIGRFSSFILLSAMVGYIISVLNFFFLCVFVSRAVDKAQSGDTGKAKFGVQASSTVRLIAMLVIYIVLFKFEAVDLLSSVLPLVFTRLTITVVEFFRKKGADEK